MWLAGWMTWLAPAAQGPISYDDEEEPAPPMPADEAAARRACTMCHLFVEPDMLTRKNWAEQILPRMMVRLGVAVPDYASSPEGALIKARKIYTEKPMIPVEEWPLIEHYYLTHAPEEPLPQDPRPPIGIGLPLFKTEPPRFRTPLPTTTMVQIWPERRQILVGDERTETVTFLDSDGRPTGVMRVGNVPVGFFENEGRHYLTCVGSFMPSEIYRAEVKEMLFTNGVPAGLRTVLDHLPRTTQMAFGDFNEDGRTDFALCMFGNLTGRFSWFENLGNDRYEEHVLANQSGAMNCYARDLNGDGHTDLAVLMAQELEMLIYMYNDGHGNFTGEMKFQKPPVYGHSYFEFADFNHDGLLDVVVCNGDNGEYSSPTKKYHGIRVLMNRGNNLLEEAFFFPMNGVYGVRARDFDEDGDLDMAAIAYFPDYKKSPRESFVYLENQGNWRFKCSTFRECISGRWLVMDAGDVDGDGDIDLVLGSHIHGPEAVPVPRPLLRIWEQQGPSIQILRNQLRDHRLAPPLQPDQPAAGG
ncbi:MAG: VCBS repeat-containing protein [Verrucomicrobia bacterium]|nr:MAG: VCBS repeat-containing protein [Verrucomicrobiota bacterium]